MKQYAVVMAGGQGTRLWPLSRKSRPKQFLRLGGNGLSLLQSAVKRAEQIVGDLDQVLVVAPAEQDELIREQLRPLPLKNLIFEPVARNTAAVVGLAAFHIQERNPEAVMGVFPADHLFRDIKPWITSVRAALEFASDYDQLVTIGLEPAAPSPSYGYLQLGNQLTTQFDLPIYKVHSFVEKPTIEVAKQNLENGDFLWNTGTFSWKVSAILDAFKRFLPDHFVKFQQIRDSQYEWNVISEIYPSLDNISIDYGLMEKSTDVAVVKADFERIDLGNLSNLEKLFPPDEGGNVLHGDVFSFEGENNLVYDDTANGITGVFGLSDIILIRQGDVVLALPKSEAHRIKVLLAEIRQSGMEKYL